MQQPHSQEILPSVIQPLKYFEAAFRF